MPSLEVTLGWGRWLWQGGKEQQGQELPKMCGTGTRRCPQGFGTWARRREPIQIPHYNKRAVGQRGFKATRRNLAVKQKSRSKHVPGKRRNWGKSGGTATPSTDVKPQGRTKSFPGTICQWQIKSPRGGRAGRAGWWQPGSRRRKPDESPALAIAHKTLKKFPRRRLSYGSWVRSQAR